MNLETLNHADPETFAWELDGIFEESPWIAREVAGKRPFASADELFQAMVQTVRNAPIEKQEALIQAHPRLGSTQKMTAESQREQEAAGLKQLGQSEARSFTEWTIDYEQRFGFPFIIAVRGLTKDEIREAIKKRIRRTKAEEFSTALEEIYKIARFRLEEKLETH